MSVKLTLRGVDELREALRHLPDDLAGEAGAIIRDAATTAHRDVEAEFAAHVVTGNLERRLELHEVAAGRYGAILKVIDRAKHAWLFEHGSAARHWLNGKLTGTMPAAHVFVKAMVHQRAIMWDRLRVLVERHGLKVTGRV